MNTLAPKEAKRRHSKMRPRHKDRVKLLISIIHKDDQSRLTDAINRISTSMHFSGIGHGTARSHHRSYFGIDDVEKRVTFSLIPQNLEAQILSQVNRELKLFLFGKGIAFTMPLSAISNIVEEPILASAESPHKQKRRKRLCTSWS